MNEIDSVTRIRPEPAEPDPETTRSHRETLLQRARAENARRVRRGRLRMPKPALGGAATALAVGIAVIALVAGGVWPGDDPAGPSQEPGTPRANQSRGALQAHPSISLKAATVLDKAAQAAGGQPAAPAQPDQWAYTKYVLKEPGRSETNQVWRQVDGSGTFVRTTYSDGTTHEQRLGDRPDRDGEVYVPPLLSPSYAYLQDLPTDPVKLRRLVYTQARKSVEETSGTRYSVDQRVFSIVSMAIARFGGLGGVDAALYQVLRTVPGIVVRPEVADATGRHGIGITYDSRRMSMVLIFDEETYEFIGARLPGERRTTALTASGIVDQAGKLPR